MADIFLFLGGFVDPTHSWYYEEFITTNATDPLSNGSIEQNEQLSEIMGLDQTIGANETSTATPGVFSALYNGIVVAWNGLQLLAVTFFAPIVVLQKTGAPFAVVLVFGVVSLVALTLAVLSFIRGTEL